MIAWQVHKFGGSSVADAACFERVARILETDPVSRQAVVLSACGNGNDTPSLFNLEQPGNGPDEFAILPPRPLQLPENLAELPAPTPGGANLTDPTPNADAIVALGGNPKAAGGIPASDAALVRHAAQSGAFLKAGLARSSVGSRGKVSTNKSPRATRVLCRHYWLWQHSPATSFCPINAWPFPPRYSPR